MKQIIVALLAALSFNALARDAAALLLPSPLSIILAYNTYVKDSKKVYYIRVQSQARDFEQVKKQAFRMASEQVAGTVILSESELRNSKLTRDEIITYSSGLIDEYRIVDRIDGPNFVKLTVDIWIVESVMAQRLLAKSTTEQKINGDALAVRVDSILEEQERGDRLIRAILRDYPARAYVLKVTASNTEMDRDRNFAVTVNWLLEWDQRYANAFLEAAKVTALPPCTTWTCPKYQTFIQGYRYPDAVKVQMIGNHFNEHGATVMVELRDVRGQALARTCDQLHGYGRNVGMLAYGENGVVLHTEQKLAGSAVLSIGQNTAKFAGLDTINVQVVPNNQCRILYNP